MVYLWYPPKAGRKLFSLNPLGAKGAKANFGCQTQTLEEEEGEGGLGGGGGEEGGPGGGTHPSPYSVRAF